MASSPYLPSSMPNQGETLDSVLTASIVVVREEDLEGWLVCTSWWTHD